jgi:hypothetical protein
MYHAFNVKKGLHFMHTACSCVSYDSHNKQQLFPYIVFVVEMQ